MAVSIESRTLVSLTSTEDGSLIHETRHHSISPDLLVFENRLELYCSVPAEDTVYLNITGKGLCLVSVCDGKTRSVSLYLLNLRAKLDEQLTLNFNNHRTQVISIFNEEAITTEIEQEEKIQVKLTILEGKFTSTFSMNGETLLEQTCDLAKDGNRTQLSGTSVDDIFPRSIDTENSESFTYDQESGTSVDDIFPRSIDTEHSESFTYDQESLSSGDDLKDNKKSDKNIQKIDIDNIPKGLFNSFVNEEKEKEENYQNSESVSDDEKLSVYGSAGNEFYVEQPTSNVDENSHLCPISSGTERVETAVVDIRTHRTELLENMRADFLSDFFFEANLISEENLESVNESWYKQGKRAANALLLKILRNRKIPKRKIETALIKAEELHLLALMFPQQAQVV